MHTNESVMKSHWDEIKGELRKSWSRVSDDELDKTKGEISAVENLIQKRYGISSDAVKQKLSEIFVMFESQSEHPLEAVEKPVVN